MMKLKYLRLLIALAVLFGVGDAVRSQTEKKDEVAIRMGTKTVLVPSPEGLQEVSQKLETVTATFKATEPPQNDLLAAYVAHTDLELLQRGGPALMDYYAKVSTLKQGREQNVSQALFEAVVNEFRKNTDQYLDTDQPSMKKLIENFEKEVSKLSSTATNLELTTPKNLGTFNLSPSTYSVLLLSAVKIEARGETFNRMVLVGASLVYVQNRILFVNSYRTYKSEADLETMKESVKKWTESILAANVARVSPARRN